MSPILFLILIILVAFFVYEYKTIMRQSGIWRAIYVIPSLIIIIASLNIYLGISYNPTSHNLFPFELVGYLIIAVGAHVIIALINFLVNRLTQE